MTYELGFIRSVGSEDTAANNFAIMELFWGNKIIETTYYN